MQSSSMTTTQTQHNTTWCTDIGLKKQCKAREWIQNCTLSCARKAECDIKNMIWQVSFIVLCNCVPSFSCIFCFDCFVFLEFFFVFCTICSLRTRFHKVWRRQFYCHGDICKDNSTAQYSMQSNNTLKRKQKVHRNTIPGALHWNWLYSAGTDLTAVWRGQWRHL